MEEPVIYQLHPPNSWSEAWANTLFRKKIIGAVILFLLLLIVLPFFFAVIETRKGVVLNDWLLPFIPARDVSITIFIMLWSTSLLMIIRCIQQPAIFLMAIYLLIAITLTRLITISLIPLDPPSGLIVLKDPITSLTYGGLRVFITKDLFFSGHTANLFMFYLCLQKKRDKQFAIFATIIVGSLLLVQHVHYAVDVIAALLFTYALTIWARRLKFFAIR